MAAALSDRPVLFLEHDVDHAPPSRIDRWWAGYGAGGSVTLPLAMVSSGHAVSNGSVGFETVYRTMVEDDLERPAEAAVAAYARRLGSTLRVYVRAENLSQQPLSAANAAALHVLVWEETRVADTGRFVRAAAVHPVADPLDAGQAVTATDDFELSGVVWERVHAVALLDYRPGGDAGPFDVLQAAPAAAPALTSVPAALEVEAGPPSSSPVSVRLRLAGPYNASWTAASDAPWLTAEPGSAGLPATVTVTVDPRLLPWGQSTGTLTFAATSSDGLDLSLSVPVTVGRTGRPVRRLLGR